MSEGSQAPSVHIISPDDGSTGKEEDSCDNRSDYGMSDESRHVKTEEGDISPPKFIQRKPRQSAQLQSYRPLTEIRSESGPSSLRTSCRSSNSHSIRESPTLLCEPSFRCLILFDPFIVSCCITHRYKYSKFCGGVGYLE